MSLPNPTQNHASASRQNRKIHNRKLRKVNRRFITYSEFIQSTYVPMQMEEEERKEKICFFVNLCGRKDVRRQCVPCVLLCSFLSKLSHTSIRVFVSISSFGFAQIEKKKTVFRTDHRTHLGRFFFFSNLRSGYF